MEQTAALPGMEQITIEEVSDKAIQYIAARDSRIDLLRKEIVLRDELIELMHKHEISSYRDENLVITLDTKEKIKVKIEDDDDSGVDEES
jgi:hypothetical protein